MHVFRLEIKPFRSDGNWKIRTNFLAGLDWDVPLTDHAFVVAAAELATEVGDGAGKSETGEFHVHIAPK